MKLLKTQKLPLGVSKGIVLNKYFVSENKEVFFVNLFYQTKYPSCSPWSMTPGKTDTIMKSTWMTTFSKNSSFFMLPTGKSSGSINLVSLVIYSRFIF